MSTSLVEASFSAMVWSHANAAGQNAQTSLRKTITYFSLIENQVT
jgi:hypothetical protein